ncbi:hypothetical protein AKJ65_06290 [candidate division MSBL1 archaeon SCGC-AAA259E19]|uniref:Uncharacterized protein n=1 Tax=candidate division MSBL1 archaeon SCGC-AAA259E19 TaxID=1698264 RepID=A0A133UGY3_9EURY|nr:hypothetical protein AKJ65_06290 [candidate division MSBL1 archaeon SCGC-AAA259E19]
MWRALKVIGEGKNMGRKKIAGKLGLGEGSTRTILDQLKDMGLAESTPAGHSLTEAGRKKMEEKSKRLLSLEAGDLTVGEKDVMTLVQQAGSKVHLGVRQRDEAIKAGAQGATVLIFRDGELQLPGVAREIDEKVASIIESEMEPFDEDVIIIGSGETEKEAERAALAAAKSLEA